MCNQCMQCNIVVDTYSNVSRSPPVRVVDVRVQKFKAGDKLSFRHHRTDTFCKNKGRGEVLPETLSLAMASPQRQNST